MADAFMGRKTRVYLPGLEVGGVFESPILRKELVAETMTQKYRTAAGSGRGAKTRGSQSSKKTKVAVKAIK